MSRSGDASRGPSFGIRFIVTTAAVAVTAFTVLAVGSVQERNSRAALTTEITTRLLLNARNLALTSVGALLSDVPELVLHPLIKEMHVRQPELELIVVVDHEGVIQGHAESRSLGTRFEGPSGLAPMEFSRGLGSGEHLMGNERLLLASSPVLHPSGEVIGNARVGMEREYIHRIISSARSRQILILAILLTVGVLATLVLMTSLLRPIGVLRAGLQRIGRGDLDSPVRLRDRTELGMLADTVNDMASKLKQAQAEMVEKERLAHELELARRIQGSLLPDKRIVAKSFVVDGTHRAAYEVGGDYYDIFQLQNGNVGVAVADVAGKGLAGCMVMSMLSALLRAYRERFESPSQLLGELDERLSETLQPGTFVTMFYGLLDPASGRMVFASAGHSPTMVFRRTTGDVEQHKTKGIPIGAIRGGAIRKTLHDQVVVLGPGDTLLQFTDGLNEAFDAAGEVQFDFERIEAIFTDKAVQGCRALLEGLRIGVDQWRGGGPRMDDETVLVVSREICVPVTAHHGGTSVIDNGACEDGLRWLQAAREHGERLDLVADLEQLRKIFLWFGSRKELRDLDESRRKLLGTALYEACANIAEHGYRQDVGRAFQLWWLPHTVQRGNGDRRVFGDQTETSTLGAGAFVILDTGQPFSAGNWVASDFGDDRVRQRGRGFGLDIICHVMSRVVYHPGTEEGNVTVLCFELDGADEQREARRNG